MKQIYPVAVYLLLALLPWMTAGQTPIGIHGPDGVCRGSQAVYSVTPSPGITYDWSVSAHGNLTGNGGASVTAAWGAPGTATVSVDGYNSARVRVEAGTLQVNVSPLPEPSITWDSEVGCEVAYPGEDGDSASTEIEEGACIRVCEGSYVAYSADIASGETVQWRVNGGMLQGSSSAPAVTVRWGTRGAGSITATVTGADGCTGSRTVCTQILPSPEAEFYIMPDPDSYLGCEGRPVSFVNTSHDNGGSPIVSYYWEFGDGAVSSLQHPTHTYETAGGYEVRLTVTNACNCASTYVRPVEIGELLSGKIECPSVICEGAEAEYDYAIDTAYFEMTGQDYTCDEMLWRVSGGTILSDPPYGTRIRVRWDQAGPDGFGYVMFDHAACRSMCGGMAVAKVPVIQLEGSISGPDVVCAGSQVRFRLPQWPATVFNWNLKPVTGAATLIPTDQPNEYILRADGEGIVEVQTVYRNTLLQCGGTAIKEITIVSPRSISGQAQVCAGNIHTYTVSPPAAGGVWTLKGPDSYTRTSSGASFTDTFPVPGTYTLSVTGNDFCAQPLRIQAFDIPAAPDTLYGPVLVCAGIPYAYTAGDDLPGAQFRWRVKGNASVSPASGRQTDVIFSGAGPWTVQVWRQAQQAPFCSGDTLSLQVEPDAPLPDIAGPDTACSNTYHAYTAGYSRGDVYDWQVIPQTAGSIATGTGTPDVTVLWNQVAAAQWVSLAVKISKCGLEYTDTMRVWVTPAPSLVISVPSDICREAVLTASVSGSPALTSGTVTWAFGDGSVYTGAVPGAVIQQHAYTALNQGSAGYNITVKVQAPNGCFSDAVASAQVTVLPAPVAYITPAGPFAVCDTVNLAAMLEATVQSGFGSTQYIDWYRDGSLVAPGGAGNTSFLANATGNYYAMVRNDNGCAARTNIVAFAYDCPDTCEIDPVPEIILSSMHTACGEIAASAAYSAGGFDPRWDWPPTAVSADTAAASGTFTFDKAGLYRFGYSVAYRDVNGDTCRVSDDVYALVPYIAGLKYRIACGTATGTYNVTLFDHSNYHPQTPISNWAFYINGSQVQRGSQTSYTASLAPGAYYLRLVISSPGLPSCEALDTLVLPALPAAGFTFDHDYACAGMPVKFTSTSTPAGLAHSWEFGDQAENLQVNPERVYAITQSRDFFVKLTVSDIYGCSDSVTRQVNIVANQLDGNIANPVDNFCEGASLTLLLSNTGTITPTTYYWQRQPDDTIITTTNNQVNVYTSGGYYVSVTDQYGCMFTSNIVVAEFIRIPIAAIRGDSLQCTGRSFTLSGYAGSDITDYTWYRDGVQAASGNFPELQEHLSSPGTYDYRLVIRVPNPSGGYCSDTSPVFTVRAAAPAPPPTLSYSVADCNAYTVQLSADNNGRPGVFNWSNGMSGNPVSIPGGGGPYKVWVTSPYGCVSSAGITVPRDPEAYLWIFPSGCLSFCDNPYRTLHGPSIPFAAWEWSYNQSSAASGSGFVPPYPVTAGGAYGLSLDNGLCSRASDTLTVSGEDCDCSLMENVIITIDDFFVDRGTPCANYMDITLDNYLGQPIQITSSAGVLLPPVSEYGGRFVFIPDPGFHGGPMSVTFSATMEDGTVCTYTEYLSGLDDLCNEFSLKPEPGKQGVDAAAGLASAFLRPAPNPASGTTWVYYGTGRSAGNNDVLEVYDLSGRLRDRRSLNDERVGMLRLDVSGYAAGLYVVVLRSGGAAVAQTKLSVY